MTDQELRELYARATATRADARRSRCPAPEALLALTRREGAETARLETLDHVMSCADCRQEFELLRAIEQAGRAESSSTVVRWRRPLVMGVATALAAALAFVAVLRPWSSRGALDVVRSAATDVTLVAPAPDSLVAASAVAFAWHPVAGARSYTLEVITAAGDVRATRGTTDTSATISRSQLGSGDLRWSVQAQLDGGDLRSETRRLRLSKAP